MGDRGQVLFEPSGVYLYTHWGNHHLVDDVRRALNKKARWNDVDYLARIVFDEMTRDAASDTTGFGIGTQVYGDIIGLVAVDTDDRTVTVHGYDHAIRDMGEMFTGSFEEFITEYRPDDEN